MRICHIAHGVMEIPPSGWGAVEGTIAQHQRWSAAMGHDCYVINTPDSAIVAQELAFYSPDVVYAHCEQFFSIVNSTNIAVKVLCSHWPGLFQPKARAHARKLFAGDAYVSCLSDHTRATLIKLGCHPGRLLLTRNGADSDEIAFRLSPQHAECSICLAAVDPRKRQSLLSGIDSIHLVGPLHDQEFDTGSATYLGEWSRAEVAGRLTDYANLVLISREEVAPKVVPEALMAGLGVVLSEAASVNLDTHLPFITIVPESRIHEKTYVARAITQNREIAVSMRDDIRRYAIETFEWETILRPHISELEALFRYSLDQTKSTPEKSGILKRILLNVRRAHLRRFR